MRAQIANLIVPGCTLLRENSRQPVQAGDNRHHWSGRPGPETVVRLEARLAATLGGIRPGS